MSSPEGDTAYKRPLIDGHIVVSMAPCFGRASILCLHCPALSYNTSFSFSFFSSRGVRSNLKHMSWTLTRVTNERWIFGYLSRQSPPLPPEGDMRRYIRTYIQNATSKVRSWWRCSRTTPHCIQGRSRLGFEFCRSRPLA